MTAANWALEGTQSAFSDAAAFAPRAESLRSSDRSIAFAMPTSQPASQRPDRRRPNEVIKVLPAQFLDHLTLLRCRSKADRHATRMSLAEGIAQVAKARPIKLTCVGKVGVSTVDFCRLGRTWGVVTELPEGTVKRLRLLIFFRALTTLRNDGVTGSSPVSGTRSFTGKATRIRRNARWFFLEQRRRPVANLLVRSGVRAGEAVPVPIDDRRRSYGRHGASCARPRPPPPPPDESSRLEFRIEFARLSFGMSDQRTGG